METPYPADELREHYRRMVLIRRFEEALSDMFAQGLVPGTAHFSIGQEACAVGAVAALRPDDLITSNHRGHGHFLAKGADPKRLMAELFGKATGYCGGRGASQHLCCIDIGFLGSNGVTGGMVPIATGAALSQMLLGTGRIVLAFFGDGATGQGVFHEAVNMAAIWKLPVVYFCENNLYAMSMRVDRAFAIPSVAERVRCHGIPAVAMDGMDYFEVRKAVEEAAARARAGGGPSLIEARTYRFCGHSKSDDCAYRTREEEEQWRKRDPILIMRRRLLELGVIDQQQAQEIDEQAEAEVREAVEFARRSPDPSPEAARQGVYACAYPWPPDGQGPG